MESGAMHELPRPEAANAEQNTDERRESVIITKRQTALESDRSIVIKHPERLYDPLTEDAVVESPSSNEQSAQEIGGLSELRRDLINRLNHLRLWEVRQEMTDFNLLDDISVDIDFLESLGDRLNRVRHGIAGVADAMSVELEEIRGHLDSVRVRIMALEKKTGQTDVSFDPEEEAKSLVFDSDAE